MESGATAWEVRELARIISLDGALLSHGNDTLDFNQETCMERAILVEALELLAEKKEREKKAA